MQSLTVAQPAIPLTQQTRCKAKPDCSPPGYPSNHLLIIVLLICYAFCRIQHNEQGLHSTTSAPKSNKENCIVQKRVTHTFNVPLFETTQVSQYQICKINLDFTEARSSEWQWHQLGRMQVCTSLQTDIHASTPPLSFFYRLDALPANQPTASKH